MKSCEDKSVSYLAFFRKGNWICDYFF